MIGREGGWGKTLTTFINKCVFGCCSLLWVFCIENIIRKKWASIEQALNETVAIKSRRYVFANPENFSRINVIFPHTSTYSYLAWQYNVKNQ